MTRADLSVKDIEELHTDDDPLDTYEGKWVNQYFFKDITLLGTKRYNSKKEAEKKSRIGR